MVVNFSGERGQKKKRGGGRGGGAGDTIPETFTVFTCKKTAEKILTVR